MGILSDLHRLSAAEDFFRALEVAYEPNVLRVARLHIMRRFGQYLERQPVEDMDEASTRRHCQALLRAAHDDFAGRSPLRENVFSVLQAARAARGLVPADTLNRQGREEPTRERSSLK